MSHQAAPRQGWPRGMRRMLLESGGELLQEAPETRGKGHAGVPGLLPCLSNSHGQEALPGSSPCTWGPAHALQQSMCLLGIKTVRKHNEGSAWEHSGLRSPVWCQEGLCSGTGSGAVSRLFPGRFSKFPRNLTLWRSATLYKNL